MSDDEQETTRTRVPLPIATLSDPHLGDAAKHPSRVEGIIALIFVLGIVMTAGFGLRSRTTAASGSGGFDMRPPQ